MTEQESSEPSEEGVSEASDGVETADGEGVDGAESAHDAEGADSVDAADSLTEDDVVDDELVERVEDESAEVIAGEIATLELEIDGLEAKLDERDDEIDELTSKLKRKQADFENYKKRMNERREQERKRATENLVERLLDVRDNLQRALDQDEGVDVRDGVASTLRQFDDVLAAEDVEPIEPDPGEEVDPRRHQVLARVEADVPEDTIADVHRPGYAMADSVLREAQVTVSEGPNGSGDDASTEATTDGSSTDEAADGDEA